MDEEIIENAQESRRDMLASSFDNLDAPVEETKERARDDAGRFAAEEVKPQVEEQPAPAVEAAPEPTKRELTTWRKEYRPIQEKLGRGEPLTPEEAKKLYEYNFERESQYASGVAGFKSEAQQANELRNAMNEFMPILQKEGINPAQWITNLGNAHKMLALGSPEQKIQMFSRLAQEYGVPIGAITQAQNGQLDPVSLQLMQEIQNLKQNVSGVVNWRQQQEQQYVNQELAKFSDASQYPHFEQVRGDMALLLESGRAQDLDAAYKMAVRLNDDAWRAEQDRIATQNQAQQDQARQAALNKAKASAKQVKSATPSTIIPATQAKDRRGSLMEAFESIDPGRV